METPQKCLRCPREAERIAMFEVLAFLREKAVGSAQIVMDDANAAEAAHMLYARGIIHDPTDLDTVRTIFDGNFDQLDNVESEVNKSREVDMRFCVGSLTMRVNDPWTKFDVTVCRSPNSRSAEGVELARVTRTPLSS